MTRAAAAAARGDLASALRLHPLLPVVALEAVLFFVLWARRLTSGRAWPRRALSVAALATAALFVLVWIARLLAGSLPA